MLSYRHTFHAGNHADVLKHVILHEVLCYYLRKNKAFVYIDTHAGAGLYDLQGEEAAKNREWATGIARLRLNQKQLSTSLRTWLDTVDALTHNPHFYPGSPVLAAHLMRPQDYIRAFELHPQDSRLLTEHMKQTPMSRRVSVTQTDGLKGALAYLPPPNRRAVVMIDPSYEQKNDYQQIPKALARMQQRCREACFMLWYPRLARSDIDEMIHAVLGLSPDHYVRAELHVQAPSSIGMYGSGVIVLNPPYVLADTLATILPQLVTELGENMAASNYQLDGRNR